MNCELLSHDILKILRNSFPQQSLTNKLNGDELLTEYLENTYPYLGNFYCSLNFMYDKVI